MYATSAWPRRCSRTPGPVGGGSTGRRPAPVSQGLWLGLDRGAHPPGDGARTQALRADDGRPVVPLVRTGYFSSLLMLSFQNPA